MKKLFVTLLTFLTSGAAVALPVGNPSDASLLCDGLVWEGHCGDPCDPCLTWSDAFSLRFGFYGDYVFNRHLKVHSNESHKQIERTQLFTNAGYISANFWDRVDIFAVLGATNLMIDSNAISFGGPGSGSRVEVETDSDFSWSLGARSAIWECGCTTLGAEFQYFETRPDIKRVTFESTNSIYPNNVNAKYWEWQIGVGLSHRINIFVPYVAVKYSRAKTNFDRAILTLSDATELHLNDFQNDKNVGFAVGTSLVDCEKASLTVEGRFGDEKAFHVNGQIRF